MDEQAKEQRQRAIEQRRQAMVAKLDQRKKVENPKKAEGEQKGRQLDELLKRASTMGIDDPRKEETIKELQERLELTDQNYEASKIKKALLQLRNYHEAGSTQIEAFQFSAVDQPTFSIPEQQSEARPVNLLTDSSETLQIENLTSVEQTFSGQDEMDVSIKNIESSTIFVAFRPSTVRIRDVKNSKIVLLPSTASLSVHNCDEMKLFASAHQIRVHDSSALWLHCAVNTNILLEGCTNVMVAPYRILLKEEIADFPVNDNWKKPRDLDQIETIGMICTFRSTRSFSTTLRRNGWKTSTKPGYIEPELGDKKPTHIIVGAGSAGCVLANRLTEDPSNRVLLIEAGPKDHWWDWRIHMPAALMHNLDSERYNWYYYTTAQKHMNNRTFYNPRGRVWGGTSSLNAMCYVRGHAHDYDRWEKEGAMGWAYRDCLPYFRKAETFAGAKSDDPYRGHNGPLRVQQGKSDHVLHQAWLETGKFHPVGTTEDMNGYKQEGIAKMDMTIHDGYRWSASRAYLWPILNRPNLHVSSGITCTKILTHKDRAIGIEYLRQVNYLQGLQKIDAGFREKIYCENSVILSGGAFNSPQLLMLSGIGPAEHIKSLGIDVVQDTPGVGSNLQDHLEIYVQQKCTQPVTLYNKSSWKFPHNMIAIGLEWFAKRTGLGASSHLESGGFARSSEEVDHPDIQFHFLPSTVHDDGRGVGQCHAYQVHVGPMRSMSHGTVRLQNKDPRRPPIIDPNYLSLDQDRREFRRCIRLSRELFALPPFDPFRGEELAPGPDCVSDAQLDDFVRAQAASAYHPSCTCKMGSSKDNLAVVDPKTMNVHGFENLKIVDASVMPSIVSGNLNAPTIMLAERAADLIQGKTSLPPSDAPMALPVFDIEAFADNTVGWGPRTNTDETNLPFQQFNKADRIGRVADWIGVDRYFRRGERYNERVYGSAANAGSQFDYVHEMDENNFQLVDSSRPVQRAPARNFRTRQMHFRKLLQNQQERRDTVQHMQSQKMKRSIAKEHQRAYKQWQRRGGQNRQGMGPRQGRFGDNRPKDRLPSVQVRPEWDVLEEMDFPRLLKLNLPGVTATGQDIGDHQYGSLYYYDKAIDRVSVKNPSALQRCGGSFYNVTTIEDPVMEKLAKESAGNVFATDIILATLMTAPRSVYSWDIVAHRVDNKLFFDRRDTGGFSNPVDALTVSETSPDPPNNDVAVANNARDLATEALYINQNFRRQVLRREGEATQTYKYKHPQCPFDEEGEPKYFGYRKFSLGNGADGKPIEVVVRTEHDGVMVGVNGEVQTLTIKAFNEWDSTQANGVDWRAKLDTQKGAVLATEMKNNGCKLAKWTVQSVLAGSDAIKFGYVSRLSPKNTAQHVILGTQQLRPMEFAQNIALNFDNCWGILRVIIDSLMKRKPGKYLLMKDPQAPMVRLYSLPDGTFESEDESDSSDQSEEEN
ncbi:unnamed protein product, partial [Mesorhabditis belari]|uniref:Eukaryotic translation initiation factor 3 subunit D n=1 Tax=Mesorhabditis belari TaxID=2138241 RepID=A0AAF3J6W8_9BILA